MADVYIDPSTGNDLSGDGSSSYPYASIQGAYDSTTPADDTVFHLSDAASDVLTADIDSSSPNNWDGSRHTIAGWDRGNGGYGVLDGNGSYRCSGNGQQKTFWHRITFTNGPSAGNLFYSIGGACIDCKFTNTGATGYVIIPRNTTLIGCLFDNVGSSNNGTMNNGGGYTFMHKCLFKEGANSCYKVCRGHLHATNSVFWLNGGGGLWDGESYNLTNCVFYQQSAGTDFAVVPAGGVDTRTITNCYFEGWNYAIYAQYGQTLVADNAFYNNSTNVDSSGSDMFYDAGTNEILSASGLTDANNGDFSPTTDLIAKGFPSNLPGTSTATNFPIGAITPAASSGSGSSSSSSKWTTITDLTGLVAWYKPETLASTYSNGDSITTWADSSGNGYDLTGSGTTRPLALANAMGTYMGADFDGTDDILSSAGFSWTSSMTCMAIVMQRDVDKNYNHGVILHDSSTPQYPNDIAGLGLIGQSNHWVDGLNTAGRVLLRVFDTESGIPSIDTPYIFTLGNGNLGRFGRGNGTKTVARELYRAGGSSSALINAPSTTAYIHMGFAENVSGTSTYALNGKICEVIIWSPTSNTNEVIWVEGYLADKYGITLADGHLFKNAAPQSSPTTYNATGSSSTTYSLPPKFTRL